LLPPGRCTLLLYYCSMGIEDIHSQEQIGRGQLYFLSHAGSELFSGYGLTTQEGRKDRLIGLVMVDRPDPVDPQWLAEITRLYSDYQLLPMTKAGERGLLAQLRIAPKSVPLLERFAHPITRDFTRMLKPLLDSPPAPILKLSWDEEQKLWASQFWHELPPALQEVFEKTGDGCLAVEREDMTAAFVTHASETDIEQFRDAQVLYQWELIQMPSAPLIRYRAAILDDPFAPYLLEHFLNVSDPDQAHCLSRLVNQTELSFDFYGAEFEYSYSKKVAHPEVMRQRLEQIVRRAIDVYGEIPPEERDFNQAKAEFQRHFSV
jgi:hypothetical protein